jgi:hypothetical protein
MDELLELLSQRIIVLGLHHDFVLGFYSFAVLCSEQKTAYDFVYTFLESH